MEQQFIGFRLQDRVYAMDILSVREIVQATETAPLPRPGGDVAGVINLRDEVIAVLDLPRETGEAPASNPGNGHIMVLCAEGRTAGLRVDGITGVLSIDASRIEPLPETATTDSPLAVNRVARLDDGLVLLPDPARFFGGLDAETNTAGPNDLEKEEIMPIPVERNPSANAVAPELSQVGEALALRAEHRDEDQETARRIVEEVQRLMRFLADGELNGADGAISAIAKLSEKKLFDEVGGLTRKLHESLKEFRSTLDPKIKSMATHDMPEAADNLEQVIHLTDQSANKTLGIVEQGQDDVDATKKQVDGLMADLSKLKAAGVEGEVLTRIENAAQSFQNHLERTSAGYTEIMMSQDFQDLTGQIIRRIIKLVHEIEEQLVRLIQNFGVEIAAEEPAPEENLKGPASDTRIEQNDVDDLLSSFGF